MHIHGQTHAGRVYFTILIKVADNTFAQETLGESRRPELCQVVDLHIHGMQELELDLSY